MLRGIFHAVVVVCAKQIVFLLQNTLRFVIPYLVKKASSSSSAILRLIAKELKLNRREMLLENFKFIFSFLVRTCSPAELEKALSYVQVELYFLCLQSLLYWDTCLLIFRIFLCELSFDKDRKPRNLVLPRDDSKKSSKSTRNRKGPVGDVNAGLTPHSSY